MELSGVPPWILEYTIQADDSNISIIRKSQTIEFAADKIENPMEQSAIKPTSIAEPRRQLLMIHISHASVLSLTQILDLKGFNEREIGGQFPL